MMYVQYKTCTKKRAGHKDLETKPIVSFILSYFTVLFELDVWGINLNNLQY